MKKHKLVACAAALALLLALCALPLAGCGGAQRYVSPFYSPHKA